MPTGYTMDIENGKITTGKDFILRCARAFGGLVHMRDEPMDAKIRKAEPYILYRKIRKNKM